MWLLDGASRRPTQSRWACWSVPLALRVESACPRPCTCMWFALCDGKPPSTSDCGLETDDRHCPAMGCHPGPSPAAGTGTASWLCWDRNPVWSAAKKSEAGLVGAPRSGQTMSQTVRKQEAAAENTLEPTACADGQSDGSEDEQWVSRSCASASCLVLVNGKEAPSMSQPGSGWRGGR